MSERQCGMRADLPVALGREEAPAAAARRRALRRPRDRRRRHRLRRRAGRGQPGSLRRAGGEARLRGGHVEPLQQAHPRRPALPRAVRPGTGPRGAARAASAHREPRAAPRPRDAVPAAPGARHQGPPYMGAGLLLYDALAGARPAMPRHRHLSHAACLRAVPSLRDDALTGGIRYYDAQVDDARFAVTLAGTAFAHGAACVSAVEVTGFLHEGGASPAPSLRDLERGDEFDMRARVVINATGVWTTEIERLAGVERPLQVRPVQGRAHRRPARPHRLELRPDPADGEERAVRAALGRPLDHRDHRHAMGVRPRSSVCHRARHRLPARARQRRSCASR